MKDYMKQWYKENKEKCGQYSKKSYQKNKEKIKQKAIRWKKDNPEKVKEIAKKANKKYISKHRKRWNSIMRNYYKKSKKKWDVRSATYFHKEKILKIHENKCDKCGNKENLEIHHSDYIWERGHHRNDLFLNFHKIAVLCKECHRIETNLNIDR